jgi:hypothetical protein
LARHPWPGHAKQVVRMEVEILDPALRAANVALLGRTQRETSRFAAIELRFSDRRSRPWEAAAMFSVGFMALLAVLGVWFL